MRVGLVADDLTGACDSAVHFLAGGRVEVGIWPHIPGGELSCAAISTETREARPATSLERSRTAARELRRGGFRLLYSKVDSLLRGNLAADLEGVLADWGGSCLLAPALPGEGRLTRQGALVWTGGRKPIKPLLGSIASRVSIRDAETDADLAALADEVARTARLLPAGSAGLAAQLPRALGMGTEGTMPAPAPSRPRCRRPLALVGSPAAFAQAGLAADHGWSVERWVPGDLVDLRDHDSLLLSGGATAAGVLEQLGATGIELVGQLLPGVPLGLVRGGHCPELPVVLKSGSFGDERAIASALERLVSDGGG